jgi:gas vesicle structural protein
MATIRRSTESSSLVDVINTILDKGVVIDAWLTASLVGIQILAIEARVVIASVDTYLKYADAIGLTSDATTEGLRRATLPVPAAAALPPGAGAVPGAVTVPPEPAMVGA